MTSVFLLGATWDQSPTLLQRLRESAKKQDATILTLDFWAGRKLREASLAYQSPRDFFDVGRAHDVDTLAVKLAQSWYRDIGDRLDHHGTSLAQVAEYDFTFLFIDALRSVEIAREVFRQGDPDQIVLTPQFPRIPLDRPNGICYESLPRVVEHLAQERGVPVTWSGEPPEPPARTEGGFTGLLRRRVQGVRARLQGWTMGNRDSVLFMDVPSPGDIGEKLRPGGVRWMSVPPVRAGTTEARRRGLEFEGVWEELRGDSAFQGALTHDGVPLSEVLAPRFRAFFEAGAPELITYIRGAERLIQRLRPRVLVLPEDVSPIRRATAQTFGREGIPILVVQHGAVSVDMGGFHVMPKEGDFQAVWGDIPRQWHIARGRTSDSQIVTGNPSFDRIASGPLPERGDLLRELRLPPDLGLILVVTEWFAGITAAATIEDEERYIRYALRALGQLPGYQGIVKLHPNFQGVYERLVKAIAEEEGVEVAIAKANLWDLLVLADLVIVSNSTVGLEAMMLGKPVVVVDAYEGVEMVPYVASGAALGATRPEEIVTAVRRALSEGGVPGAMEKARKAFVSDYAYVQDGKASDRVGQLIGQMMRPRRGNANA